MNCKKRKENIKFFCSKYGLTDQKWSKISGMIENQLSTLGYYQMAKSSLAVRNTEIQVPIAPPLDLVDLPLLGHLLGNMREHLFMNLINFYPI